MTDLTLRIRDVKRCRNGAWGNFHLRNKHKALITLSLGKNKKVHEWCETLLHELLHCYTTLMRRKGLKMTEKLEHDWIEACELITTNLLLQIMRAQRAKKGRT